MHLFYRNDYQKFLDYNIRDTELVEQLDDKLQLMELVITMAYQAKCNYRRCIWFSSILGFSYLQFLKETGYGSTTEEDVSRFENNRSVCKRTSSRTT